MQFVAIVGRLALATGLLAFAVPAKADLVTFESDTTGIKANGFQSNDSTHVSFSATAGRELDLNNFGSQGDGQSLASSPDDPAGKLLMNFTQPYNFLSLSFGNDDPDNTSPGDVAWLRVFSGAVLVGTSTVVLNRNDIMDQTIGFSGAFFDNAELFYGTPGGTPRKVTEIIDNVSFAVSEVPEPATLSLLLTGLMAAPWYCRRRSRAA